MKRFKRIACIVVFAAAPCFAQNTELDALVNQVKAASPRSAQIALCDRVTDSLQNAQKGNLAYRFLQMLVKHYTVLHTDSFTPDLYNKMGNFYNATANYNQALDMFNKGALLFKRQKRSQGLCNVLTNMGNTYYYLGNHDKALAYYKEGLELNAREVHDESTASNLYNNIGIIYSSRGNLLMGINFFRKAFLIYEKMGDSLSMAHAYNNFGTIHQEQDHHDSALYYFTASVKLKEKFGTRFDKLDGYHNLAGLYFKSGDYARSLQYVRKAIALQDTSIFNIDLEHTYQLLSGIYEKQHRTALAFHYYKLSKNIRDSIDARNKVSELMQREVSMEVSKTHLADSLAMAEETRIRNMQLAQKEKENTFLVISLAVAGLIALLLYNRFRVTRKQKYIIAAQKVLVEQKQKEVLDSIHYAKRIQGSLMPSEKYIGRTLRKLKENE